MGGHVKAYPWQTTLVAGVPGVGERTMRDAKRFAEIYSRMWNTTCHVVRTRDGAIRATYTSGRKVGP